ncbi:hypothetical protein [Novosphingobium sp. AAP83]|uniref:hypothetical protein n=1 Tax=Novosphingobium sp. AAP83 TaxID=1523425 RepID=UPI0012FC8397|nr:hypothetical protein [Novosphingobium sp. AAP83]
MTESIDWIARSRARTGIILLLPLGQIRCRKPRLGACGLPLKCGADIAVGPLMVRM